MRRSKSRLLFTATLILRAGLAYVAPKSFLLAPLIQRVRISIANCIERLKSFLLVALSNSIQVPNLLSGSFCLVRLLEFFGGRVFGTSQYSHRRCTPWGLFDEPLSLW